MSKIMIDSVIEFKSIIKYSYIDAIYSKKRVKVNH